MHHSCSFSSFPKFLRILMMTDGSKTFKRQISQKLHVLCDIFNFYNRLIKWTAVGGEYKMRACFSYLWVWPDRREAPITSADWPPWTAPGPPPCLWGSDRLGGSCTRWWLKWSYWKGRASHCQSPRRVEGTGFDPCGWTCSCVQRCRLCCLKVKREKKSIGKKWTLRAEYQARWHI